MKLLLDTCTFLWMVRGDPQLSEDARSLLGDARAEAYVSAATAWEIGIKYALGKLSLPDAPRQFVPIQRRLHLLQALAVSEEDSLAAGELPPLHKDPFDRLLVGQALVRGFAIVTPDPLIRQYSVPVRW